MGGISIANLFPHPFHQNLIYSIKPVGALVLWTYFLFNSIHCCSGRGRILKIRADDIIDAPETEFCKSGQMISLLLRRPNFVYPDGWYPRMMSSALSPKKWRRRGNPAEIHRRDFPNFGPGIHYMDFYLISFPTLFTFKIVTEKKIAINHNL